MCCAFFSFKQKTAYEMRISDWSSDVCSSDLDDHRLVAQFRAVALLDTGVEGIAIDVGERQAVEVRVPEHAQTAAGRAARRGCGAGWLRKSLEAVAAEPRHDSGGRRQGLRQLLDRKSTRLNSSH